MGLGAELPTATTSYLSTCPVPEPLLPWEIVARNASWLVTANYPLADYRFLPLVTLISWFPSTQKFILLLQKLVLPIPPVLCIFYSEPEGVHFLFPFWLSQWWYRRASPLLIPMMVGMGLAGAAALSTVVLIREMGLQQTCHQIDVDIRHFSSQGVLQNTASLRLSFRIQGRVLR